MAILSLSQLPADRFADHVFGSAPLGDKRRTRRAVAVAAQMLRHPGLSFSAMHSSWGQSKAAYRLMSNEAVTPDGLLGPHCKQVRGNLPVDGQTVLLIEDTSEIDYTFRLPIEGLSRVGPGNADHQGFLLHSVIAALPQAVTPGGERPPVRILGLAHQEYYLRPTERISKEAKQGYKARQNRESELFERSTMALGESPKGSRFVRVVDRGGDIFIVLRRYQEADHEFVVRAKGDRYLKGEPGEEAERISAALEKAQWCDEVIEIELRARPGQAARTARLRVRMAPVALAPPRFSKEARTRIGVKLEPVNCTVVHLLEEKSAARTKTPLPNRKAGTRMARREQPNSRLEWKLLVSWPVTTFAQAREAASHYETRWIIEEFHRTLKEGMGAERLQLETGQGLMNTVALMCPLALRMVDLRERTRLESQSPATDSGLTKLELEMLAAATNRTIKTIEEVARAIGKLGGHLGRKNDGMPGVRTLFLGWRKLQIMMEAAAAYDLLRKKGLIGSG